jgi:hypothetical protein
MSKYHEVANITVTNADLLLTVDGKNYSFPLTEISARLLAASLTERERFEISPSGYGIHWPLIDEDLSIDGLLNIQHKPSFAKRQAA